MRPKPTSTKPFTLIALRHSGTHLIQPLMRRLTGRAVSAPKGPSALTFIPATKCVVFLRDPRNIVVSHMRYKNAGMPQSKADKRLHRLLTKRGDGDGPIEHMTKWARRWANPPFWSKKDWENAPSLTVRFEQLTVEDFPDRCNEITRIAQYLFSPKNPTFGQIWDAHDYAFGTSVTYTGRHSKWQEWFGPQSLEAWNTNGGPELVRLMGYK